MKYLQKKSDLQAHIAPLGGAIRVCRSDIFQYLKYNMNDFQNPPQHGLKLSHFSTVKVFVWRR